VSPGRVPLELLAGGGPLDGVSRTGVLFRGLPGGGPLERVRLKEFHEGVDYMGPLEGTAVGGPLDEVQCMGSLQKYRQEQRRL
jgi:hypothetical protein